MARVTAMTTASTTVPTHVDGLILVDVQAGFRTAETEHVIEKILDLTVSAQKAKLPIILTRFVNLPDSLFRKELNWKDCSEDHPSSQLIEELTDASIRYPVVRKFGYSSGGVLAAHCRARGIARPLIVGIDTDSCVLACASELFDSGIAPVIETNACASTGGAEMHAAGVSLMRRMLGPAAVL